MFSSLRKKQLLPDISTLGFVLLAVPVLTAIVGALWLTFTAAGENVKFAHGNEQIISLIVTIQNDAARFPEFGAEPGRDFVSDLIRMGQLTEKPINRWGGEVRAVSEPSSIMRLETEVPPAACRRLAARFSKSARELALLKMEMREGEGIWRQAYLAGAHNEPLSFPAIDAACGRAAISTLALTIQLR